LWLVRRASQEGDSPVLEQVDRGPHCRIAQARQFDDLHALDGFFMQSHELLAPLVELLQGLVSCIFFLRALSLTDFKESSYLIRPNQ
jgi:hypothetical protein